MPVVPKPVVLAWYERPWCCSPVVPGVVVCGVWFHQMPVMPRDFVQK